MKCNFFFTLNTLSLFQLCFCLLLVLLYCTMFSDSRMFYEEIASGGAGNTRRDKAMKTHETQTDPFMVREGGIQTVRRKVVEVQTEISAPVGGAEQLEYFDAMDMPNDDPAALNAFASRVGPMMLSELEVNEASPEINILLSNWATSRGNNEHRQIEIDAFGFAIVEDGQTQDQIVNEDEVSCTMVRRTLGPIDNSHTAIGITYLPASCMCWSPSGGNLAVGFGHIQHDSWCAHGSTSAVYIWSLEGFRSNNANNNLGSADSTSGLDKQNCIAPTRNLPHSSCVTSVAFHPNVAGLLASGMFTGDVMVWDISHDESTDPQLASTAESALGQNGVSHADYISDLIWLPNKVSSSATVRCLASACADGLISTWAVDTLRRTIVQLACYKFPAGVCCLSLNPHDTTTLAAGLANGQLVFWSIMAGSGDKQMYTLDPTRSTSSTPVYIVTGSKINAASGPIYGCEWSPACPGLCVVATSDGTLLLFSQREPTMPCLRLESSSSGSLFSVCFSRAYPLLLLAASEFDGAVAFDLSDSRTASSLFCLKLPLEAVGGDRRGNTTLCATFNPSSGRSSVHVLVALGRASGNVELWRMAVSEEFNDLDATAALQSLRALAADPDKQDQQHQKSNDNVEHAPGSPEKKERTVKKKKKPRQPAALEATA